MPCYYQKAKTPLPHDPLAGKWISCGGVRDYGTPEEIEASIVFYLNHFCQKDKRGEHLNSGVYDVIITRGFHGNVAGVDGIAIRPRDIIRRKTRKYVKRGY
jgi:hypothetical protein